MKAFIFSGRLISTWATKGRGRLRLKYLQEGGLVEFMAREEELQQLGLLHESVMGEEMLLDLSRSRAIPKDSCASAQVDYDTGLS